MEGSAIKVIDNEMSPRFGHTITLVSKNKAVLFGGAIGSDGKFSINADTYVYLIDSQKWNKLAPNGTIPSPRAAHASCSVNTNQLVVYGGATGSGGLASDELYLLDLKKSENIPEWMPVPVNRGMTPGKRYGHSLVFYKPYIILFGGNLNNDVINDVWILNCEGNVIEWKKLDITDNIPPPRVYHSSAICTSGSANGMMVIFGGRRKEGQNLNDMWGLRRHRSGTWDWTKAPYKGTPKDRLQHSSVFCGNFFINIGGRSQTSGDNLPIEVYDTETSEWYAFNIFKRFRHSSFLVDNLLYIQGGLEDEKHNNPAKALNEINLLTFFQSNNGITTKLKAFLTKKTSDTTSMKTSTHDTPKAGIEFKNAKNIKDLTFSNKVAIGSKVDNKTDFGDLVRICSIEKFKIEMNEREKLTKMLKTQTLNYELHDKVIMALLRPKEWIDRMPVEVESKFEMEVDAVIRLIDTCKKICEEQPIVLKVEAPVKVFGDIHGQYQDLMRFFDLYSAPIQGPGGDIEGLDYIFLGDYVDRGTHSLETMCLLMALKIKYPDQIHLLRGNHEDRWINQAFGFQIECINRMNDDPENGIIFNKFNDFFDVLPLAAIVNDTVLCIHGGIGSSITTISDIEKINRPLEVIHEVQTNEQQLVVDILWSDPTDSDFETGIQPNSTRDPTGVGNIVKFGPDKVEEFLKTNNLTLILRAHECVMDGFERFASGQLITVFSATDYCGKHKNAGAILFLTKNFTIKPYLIYPQESPNKNWDCNEESLQLRPPTPPRNRQGSPNELGQKGSFS